MTIYTNVLKEFREELEARLTLNDIIDLLIADKVIDEKLYIEIWSQQNQLSVLLDIILKDAERCRKFIDILGKLSHMKTISESIKNSIDQIYRMIAFGGFPEFSLNYVVRNSIANSIKDKALSLDPKLCSTLVVYGLAGFGKSCLVNQVLQTNQFFESSRGAMFWINLGEYSDTSAVINPLWNLYLTAVKLTNQTWLPHKPDDITVLQIHVKNLFLDDNLAKSYIILDDVKSEEVLNVFKLHCRTIVTTQDKNVANAFQAHFVQVRTGFTKKESLELLRKSLRTDNLCSKEDLVNKIHELCDGCPMLLNIIGSILKDSREEALSTNVIWESIIEEIVKNDYLEHPTTTKVIHMIQLFVSHLSTEVQDCFHSLAVFPKHVNIRPEILMRLWNKSYFEVRQIMVELENKSLIVSFFNNKFKSYIYSVHSLVRTYFVEKANIDIKVYHKNLILTCEDVINKAPLDDPIANYIFGYFGYHVKYAGLYEMFEKYFDLGFIENKIKRVGSADLLTDFETYKSFITKGHPQLNKKLEDYINFVNSYSAHLHISPETNIIQFAFFNNDNCVFEEAKKIALKNSDNLYFTLEPYSGIHKNFPVLRTKNDAISACFLDSKELLVGTINGSIELKSFHQYQHKVQRFEGHTDQVISIKLSPDSKSFLSISHDQTARLWRFNDDLDPQSPKLKQSNWKNLHSPDENIVPHQTFKLQDDYILSGAFPFDGSPEIVTASATGKITRWCTKSASAIKDVALGLPIYHISYSHDSGQIIFAYDGKVYVYSRENLMYNGQFGILENIKHLVLLTGTDVAVMDEKKVEVWSYSLKFKMFTFEFDSKVNAVVNSHDVLVVATDTLIYLMRYKLQNIDTYKNDFSMAPTILYTLPDRIISISLERDNVRRYELLLKRNEKPQVHNLKQFDCHWKESMPLYFVVSPDNKIDIFNGNSNILTETETHDSICCAAFSSCGNYIILGTNKGKVNFFNYKKNNITRVDLYNDEITLLSCFENDESNYGSYGTVVAASNKEVAILSANKPIKKLPLLKKNSHIFYVKDYLIGISMDGECTACQVKSEIKADWSIWQTGVQIAATHTSAKLLGCITKVEGINFFKVLKWYKESSVSSVEFERKIDDEAKCICFSANAKMVAVGCLNGNIEIFDLKSKSREVLELHKKSVGRLLFAPNFETLLVSVGDQIAWWDLESFVDKTNAKKSKEDLIGDFSVFTFDPWKKKKLNETVPYLLNSTNLHGKFLTFVSSSRDFRCFLVIDEDGNIFKLEIIDF